MNRQQLDHHRAVISAAKDQEIKLLRERNQLLAQRLADYEDFDSDLVKRLQNQVKALNERLISKIKIEQGFEGQRV